MVGEFGGDGFCPNDEVVGLDLPRLEPAAGGGCALGEAEDGDLGF